MIPPSLADLRSYAISRSLFKPTTLPKAIAEARIRPGGSHPRARPRAGPDLRHRVTNYRAGDLERRYSKLPIEEDFFVNYGFVPRDVHALMHPRTARHVWNKARLRQADAVLEFVRERGVGHPREVDLHFAHGKTDELVRRFEQRFDTVAGWHALPRVAAHRAPRGRGADVCAA
jgi:hypothetical protein